jgi:hypothetical protein
MFCDTASLTTGQEEGHKKNLEDVSLPRQETDKRGEDTGIKALAMPQFILQ